jgi:tripartite-type tricarboxylate transporter receptor subunit TctC
LSSQIEGKEWLREVAVSETTFVCEISVARITTVISRSNDLSCVAQALCQSHRIRWFKKNTMGGTMYRRSLLNRTLLGAAAALVPTVGSKAAPPQFIKPIRAVAPFPAGGNVDAATRIIAEKLSPRLGQPIVVDNKTGAAGMIAAAFVAKSDPDGHTLLFTTSSVLLSIQLAKDPPLKVSDLLPVTQLFDVGIGFGVSKDLGAKDLAGFLQLAKERPGKLSYGSYGIGTGAHVIAEVLKKRSGANVVHVPYRGEAPAINDLVAGQISSAFASVGSLAQFPQKIQIVGVANARRMAQFPDVPTFDELGFSMGTLSTWGGVFAADKTPPTIVEKLASTIDQVMALPDVQQKMRELGYEPLAARKVPFDAIVKEQATAWKAAVDEANIALE